MIDWSDKEERKSYDKQYYQQNKERRIQQAKELRDVTRKAFADYKATLQCVVCGENDPACLDFHHIDPSEKEVDVAEAVQRGWSLDHIMQEIDKCVVLCRNCHAKLHAGRSINIGQ